MHRARRLVGELETSTPSPSSAASSHRIDCDVTAYAIIDLANNARPALLFSALVETVAVAAGRARTPSGLVLASR